MIGRRLGSDAVGLGGAWLAATSPVFLMMFKSQMSDVPAGAFWALASYWALGSSVGSAIAAGLAASTAILIRPNLVPLAAILCLWLARSGNRQRLFCLATGAVPGTLLVAAINNYLYGSPISSGYGELSELFSLANVPITLTHNGTWLIETQTPIVGAGIIALAMAPRQIWRTPETRSAARLLASVVVAVWATMRFDLLDQAWLDRAAEWLQRRGRHPYVLIEDWEMPTFTTRFSRTNRLGALTLAPVLAYQAYRVPGKVYLFDLLRPSGPTLEPLPIADPRPLCVPPARAAPLS